MTTKTTKATKTTATRKPKTTKPVQALDRHDARMEADAKQDAEASGVEPVQVFDQFDVAEQLGVPVRSISPVTEDIGMTPEQRNGKAEVAAPAPKAAKVLPPPAEALEAIRSLSKLRGWSLPIRVTEQTKDGSAKRVVILCGDPQTKVEGGVAVSVCQGEREIAVQDLFQVSCCAACADRKVRKARRNRAKARDKAARATVRALKAK